MGSTNDSRKITFCHVTFPDPVQFCLESVSLLNSFGGGTLLLGKANKNENVGFHVSQPFFFCEMLLNLLDSRLFFAKCLSNCSREDSRGCCALWMRRRMNFVFKALWKKKNNNKSTQKNCDGCCFVKEPNLFVVEINFAGRGTVFLNECGLQHHTEKVFCRVSELTSDPLNGLLQNLRDRYCLKQKQYLTTEEEEEEEDKEKDKEEEQEEEEDFGRRRQSLHLENVWVNFESRTFARGASTSNCKKNVSYSSYKKTGAKAKAKAVVPKETFYDFKKMMEKISKPSKPALIAMEDIGDLSYEDSNIVEGGDDRGDRHSVCDNCDFCCQVSCTDSEVEMSCDEDDDRQRESTDNHLFFFDDGGSVGLSLCFTRGGEKQFLPFEEEEEEEEDQDQKVDLKSEKKNGKKKNVNDDKRTKQCCTAQSSSSWNPIDVQDKKVAREEIDELRGLVSGMKGVLIRKKPKKKKRKTLL